MTARDPSDTRQKGEDELRIVPFTPDHRSESIASADSIPRSEAEQRCQTLDGLESWLALTNAAVWLDLAEDRAKAASQRASA